MADMACFIIHLQKRTDYDHTNNVNSLLILQLMSYNVSFHLPTHIEMAIVFPYYFPYFIHVLLQ